MDRPRPDAGGRIRCTEVKDPLSQTARRRTPPPRTTGRSRRNPPMTLRSSVERILVDDLDDPRLADYAHLTSPRVRERLEAARGIFVVEGHLALRSLRQSGHSLLSALAIPERADAVAAELAGAGVPLYVVSRAVIDQLAGYPVHRGVLAVAPRFPLPDPAALVASGSLVLVLDGVADAENVGAIFRSATALGADAVLLGPGTADPLRRRSVRVSMGAVFHVPFAPSRALPDLLLAARAHGSPVLALAPNGEVSLMETAVRLGRPSPTTPLGSGPAPRTAESARPVILVCGSEADGLRPATRAAATTTVRIPMRRGIDSLNVAAAAAIALSWLV